MSGGGHPLPASGEARHKEIPEHLEREKGRGDDSKGIVQPQDQAVSPGGEPYRYDDLGRGPENIGGSSKEEDMAEDRNSGRDEAERNHAGSHVGGSQAGGGPGPSDMAAPGGSSGSGGYGEAQNQQFHQGQQEKASPRSSDDDSSRGERFDEAQGGGRGVEPEQGDEFASDQAEHQDRGQSVAETESGGR